MSTATLRYPSTPKHAPARNKQAQRGASRMVVKEARKLSVPKPDFTLLKRVFWPVCLAILAVGSLQISDRLLPFIDRPISKVSVRGELSPINQQAIQKIVEPYAGASFFSTDVTLLRQELEQVPWISHAEVRREWPSKMVVSLEEQLPIARWGDGALLSNSGKAFAPQELASYQSLPLLQGPQSEQVKVMQQYQMLSQMLRPLGFTISRLEMRERGSWFVSTAQGVEMLLGRDQLVEKVQHFVAIYNKALKDKVGSIATVDLRYPNGLAVAWREPVVPATAPAALAN